MRATTLASILIAFIAAAALAPRLAQAVSCDTFDPCMTNGMCQPNGECTGTPAPNNTTCDDGNPCTKNDSCQAGMCTGIADVEKNGQPCDAGLGLCAVNPTCLVFSGGGFDFAICAPESFVECEETDSDQCTFNSCNPQTGQCQVFTNPCFGACGSCDPQTGQCTANPKPNGSSCDDFNTCTANDGCQAGSCVASGGSGGPTPTRTPTIAGGVPTATRTSTAAPTRTATITATITSTRTATRTFTPTSTPTGGSAACFGDCNSSGTLTASDIGRINSTILRCGPCAGNVPGGIATGCATLAGGCPPADFNTDGCLRASELARANQNILKYQPSGCAPPAP